MAESATGHGSFECNPGAQAVSSGGAPHPLPGRPLLVLVLLIPVHQLVLLLLAGICLCGGGRCLLLGSLGLDLGSPVGGRRQQRSGPLSLQPSGLWTTAPASGNGSGATIGSGRAAKRGALPFERLGKRAQQGCHEGCLLGLCCLQAPLVQALQGLTLAGQRLLLQRLGLPATGWPARVVSKGRDGRLALLARARVGGSRCQQGQGWAASTSILEFLLQNTSPSQTLKT